MHLQMRICQMMNYHFTSRIIKLYQQVSHGQDIEYKLRTSDSNFCLCYCKYLTLYRKIISKCRGQAPVDSLASAYAQFGKERGGNYLPVLHNSSRIKVQPTAVSRRKSGIKSSNAQPRGRRPKLLDSNKDANMKIRKTFNNQQRRRNLAHNIYRENLPNAGPKRESNHSKQCAIRFVERSYMNITIFFYKLTLIIKTTLLSAKLVFT